MDINFNSPFRAACAAAVLMLAGCANNKANTVAYQGDFDEARESIRAAESEGGYEHAGEYLNLARDKLMRAQEAAEEGDGEVAQRLAEEATLDAELASATARNEEMQAALSELQDSIGALESELQRSNQSGAGLNR